MLWTIAYGYSTIGTLLTCDRWVSCAIRGKIRILNFVLAMLVQFCRPPPISEPYFPQIAQLAHLLQIGRG